MFAMTVAWIVVAASGCVVSLGAAMLLMGIFAAAQGYTVRLNFGWSFWLAVLAFIIALAYIVTGGN